MDKETLSHYGWIVVLILILSVLLVFATPFGKFVTGAIKAYSDGLFGVNKNAMDAAGIDIMEQEFDDMLNDDWKTEDTNIFDIPAYALILDNGAGADTVPLVFTRSETEIKVGDKYQSITYGERTVVAVFTGFEDTEYTYSNGGATTAPWKNYASSITSVQVEEVIKPISMTGWFAWFNKATVLNLEKINTSECTSLRCTFYKCGYDPIVSAFRITGLSSWDTSKVTNMVGTFGASGHSAYLYTIEGLDNWDVSSVTDFEAFFASAGYNSTNWEMDLTGWNLKSAVSTSQMFAHAGRFCKSKIVVKGLDTWDVSNVKNMNRMFYMFGEKVPNRFTIDVSTWTPNAVTDKGSIIAGAGGTFVLPSKLQ